MRRRRRLRAVACLIGMLALSPAPAARAAGPGYVSLSFGRMQWVTTSSPDGGLTCTALPNTVTLGQAHDDLAARGLVATGEVITTRTPETGFRCFNSYTMHPGWNLISQWSTQGWSFVSGGTHADVRTLDYEGVLAESCGSIGVFRDHGIDPTGLFAYGNDSWTLGAQTDPVSRCFDFGRQYGETPNVSTAAAAPWFQTTHSVNGGLCHDSTLRCWTYVGKTTARYESPEALAAEVAAAPDTWVAMQFYRFVTGSYAGSNFAWDCRSADWRQHWTSNAELYCYGDFLMVADAIAAATANGVVAADPGSVAEAWGRVLDVPAVGEPRATSTGVSCPQPGADQPATCTATVSDVADGIPLAPRGTDSVSWSADGPGTFSALRCTPAGVRPATTCAVTFTPQAGSSTVRVRADYVGSADHLASTGFGSVAPIVPRATATVVSCPASGTTPVALTCVATVSDVDAGTPITPGGADAVSWSADSPGTFAPTACTPIGSGSTASCSTSFTPTLAAGGTVLVGAAYAGDPFHAGSTATPVPIAVAGDITSPSVRLTNPSNGATVPAGGKVTIKASATDNVAVVDVRFFVAGTLRCTDAVAPYTCVWHPTKKRGIHIVIEAVARDAAGNLASHRITVTTA